WEEFLRRVRDRKKITRLTKCVHCELKAMCGMCPANGELENGDPESPVDFLCRAAHMRAHALDLQVRPHGDCEYCEGGAGYEQLMESVVRLRAIAPMVDITAAQQPRSAFLPMVASHSEPPGATCGSGGCSSCGSH